MHPHNISSKKKTVLEITDAKKRREKLAALTAYDFSIASIIDQSGVDIILVGDSGGMVILGYPNTRLVKMSEMLLFCRSVSKAVTRSLITVDMPFGSYHGSIDRTVSNAVKLIKAGSDSVKIEGGEEICDRINAVVELEIPVMGHIGYKPQTSDMWKSSKVVGRTRDSAIKLLHDAKAIEKAGAFCIVLEMVAAEVADVISKNLTIPTIGIGSGSACDGQVLVSYDMLGIYQNMKSRFAKRYTDLNQLIRTSVQSFSREVKSGQFPGNENTYHMEPGEYVDFLEYGARLNK